jgi:adenine specific DNA methylase Mod
VTRENALFFGDNLTVLRESIRDESINLIYLDPPFNSNASYNVLFKSLSGESSQAQIEAFEDSWHWNIQAEGAFDDVMRSGNSAAAELIRAMRASLGENDMMAYLAMMAVRLIELRRVLTPTGSIYLHCDPTASHYLKILLDAIFGPSNFRNEISWKRSNPKSLSTLNFPNCRDVILRYSKSDTVVFNKIFGEHDATYVEKAYKYFDEHGRQYRLLPLLNPNDNRPNLTYEFLGVTRVWRWSRERMEKAYKDGLVVQLKPGAVPQYKLYYDQSLGRTITNDWNDIRPVAGKEVLGYPTQKPLSLLERIVSVSSNEGELVLDPFCGCGTAVHASHKLHRRWLGIDITHLAISLIEKRLKDAFPGINFEVHGTPKDREGAQALAKRDPYQFQWWAISLVNAVPVSGKKKGADGGIDGLIYFKINSQMTERAIVSVKGGENINVGMVRDLKGVLERQKAPIGIFITLSKPSQPMITEAASAGFFECDQGKFERVQILSVSELLNGVRPRLPVVDSGAMFHRAMKEPPRRASQGKLL